MGVPLLVRHLLVLAFLLLFFIASTTSFSEFEDSDEPTSTCKYERCAEVERECSFVLSLASKSKLGNEKIYEIESKLPFLNGDWVQEAGGAPLMPFDDSDMPKNFSGIGSHLKLVSFWVMGFDFSHQFDNAVSVCGLLSIGITRNKTLSSMAESWTPWFDTGPGYSNMYIPFEGLYVESDENGGERLMCLLGTSVFPFSEGLSDTLELLNDYSCEQDHQSNFPKDDRIMLVLRYPQTFTLTSRAVLGEMRSLNERSDPKYFDKVHISSQLGHGSTYSFVSNLLVSKACDPYPYQDELIDDGIQIFKGFQFCKVFQRFTSDIFDVSWISKCHGTKCYSDLGPFMLGREIEETDGILDNFRLVMKDLHCVPGVNLNEFSTAKVAAVFRAFSPLEDHYTSQARSGLSGMTISAEGIWNSSSGQLCMVGCVGLEAGSSECNSRICLHLPVTFTITQRSILIGTISSIKKTDSYTLLMFKKVLHPLDHWNIYNEYSNSYLLYKYSKIDMASTLLKKNTNFRLGVLVKKLFLKYPAVEDPSNRTSLSLLSEELCFDVNALPVPDPLLYTRPPQTFVKFQVFSLGPLFGRYWPHLSHSCEVEVTDCHVNSDSSKHRLPLNISAHLTLDGNSYSHLSELFLEGLYDPLGGRMYLIGCRNVPESQKSIYSKMKLESKMDCLIQVKIEYSSRTVRWLVNPTAKVSIASQRNEDDPLYFGPINLHTFSIPHKDNSREIIFRQNFEAIYRILMLLASIACVQSQLLYIRKKADVIPFMSLVMLGVQALGFSLPIITDATILFRWKEYEYPETRSLRVGVSMRFQMLDCTMKFLLLIAFVLTLKLCQKVWQSRQCADRPLTLTHNPGDKRVFLSTLIIHMVGFLVVLIIHNMKVGESVHVRTNQKLPEWVTELDNYMGLIQDFLLLPQVIGNVIWQIQVKPLSKVYYIGFTALRLLLHGYNYLRDPVFSPHFHKYDSNTSSAFFTKFEDVVIMMILAALAIMVHAQQRWM